jgi:hypothetical protein
MAGMRMVDTSALMMQALVQSQMKEFRAAGWTSVRDVISGEARDGGEGGEGGRARSDIEMGRMAQLQMAQPGWKVARGQVLHHPSNPSAAPSCFAFFWFSSPSGEVISSGERGNGGAGFGGGAFSSVFVVDADGCVFWLGQQLFGLWGVGCIIK